MNITLAPGPRNGRVSIPSSKSYMHRLLIAAALGTEPTTVECDGLSADIWATAGCLRALGAGVEPLGEGAFRVAPVIAPPDGVCRLDCMESGSTLRFMLPVVGALGVTAELKMSGRLPQRPIAPLDAVLRDHGMTVEKRGDSLFCSGRLSPGDYSIPGDVSSQYVTGLLMALPLLDGDSRLDVTGRVESASYIKMTEDVLYRAGVTLQKSGSGYRIPGHQRARMPQIVRAETDWSNAAFFLCMGALSDEGVTLPGLSVDTAQGDKAVLDILRRMGADVRVSHEGVTVKRAELHGVTIDASDIPDLIPVLSVTAAAAKGETRVINAARLRLKESDRLESTADLLTNLGADVTVLEDGLIIRGGKTLTGGTVSSWNDHRIAMSAAVAACAASGPVTVAVSECVNKSYPRFWADLEALKGAEL